MSELKEMKTPRRCSAFSQETVLILCAHTGTLHHSHGLRGSRSAFAGQGSNPPWFPSLMAFEHYDSGRTKLFERAHFTGSFTRDNVVDVRVSPDEYPTMYNVVYLSGASLFVFGGAFGDRENATGSFVARVDPQTLQT